MADIAYGEGYLIKEKNWLLGLVMESSNGSISSKICEYLPALSVTAKGKRINYTCGYGISINNR